MAQSKDVMLLHIQYVMSGFAGQENICYNIAILMEQA